MQDDYINALKIISLYTEQEKCWMIGSSALTLYTKATDYTTFKNFENNAELFKKRDLDLVITDRYPITTYLREIGTLTPIGAYNCNYNTMLYTSRNISSIEKYNFKLGSALDDDESLVTSNAIAILTKNRNIEFNIDIIVIRSGFSLSESVKKWPISETKRNFGIYYADNNIDILELNSVNKYKNLSAKLLCNAIETFKHIYHCYGSPKEGYSASGDKIERYSYSPNELHTSDAFFGKHKRFNDVLKGKSVELTKFIDIQLYTAAQLELSNDDICTLCLNPLKDIETKLIKLKCQHIYCVSCIMPMWISYLIMRNNRLHNLSTKGEGKANDNKCPLCRKDTFKIRNGIIVNKELNVHDHLVDFVNF